MTEYNIDDFTLSHYREILALAVSKLEFCDFLNYSQAEKPAVIWRHDLDLSVSSALKIAEVEAEFGISSTYFILPHSPFYNLLEKENVESVKKIIQLGHQVGLHFDSHFYGIGSESQLEQELLNEKALLDRIFGTDIKSFSFHLTNEFTMKCEKYEYAGLVNAYASYFKTNARYCSDSYGLWRFSRLYDFIKDQTGPLNQVLTHPEWWVFPAMMPQDRIKNHIALLSEKLLADASNNYTYK